VTGPNRLRSGRHGRAGTAGGGAPASDSGDGLDNAPARKVGTSQGKRWGASPGRHGSRRRCGKAWEGGRWGTPRTAAA
jgi:hypothetical protein